MGSYSPKSIREGNNKRPSLSKLKMMTRLGLLQNNNKKLFNQKFWKSNNRNTSRENCKFLWKSDARKQFLSRNQIRNQWKSRQNNHQKFKNKCVNQSYKSKLLKLLMRLLLQSMKKWISNKNPELQ
ncbi:hypothetical protein FGO68_gene12172 [Halteria grandinella]|uniref:Uncharacterized protein n=1 Tax=Halteria grandinella TaxID=5974 RepID=A0A8J8N9A3_HALGN|nr:hypothetical protein FGO68_gene12172 [Halteria grandinella]